MSIVNGREIALQARHICPSNDTRAQEKEHTREEEEHKMDKQRNI